MKKCLALSLVAGAAIAHQAAGADLYLVNTQNVGLLCDSVNNPTFYIGNNPSVIALTGDNLFVAGWNNSLAVAQGQMVKIETIFGARAFRLVPASVATLNPSRGFNGLTYAAGQGLVLNYDSSSTGTAGAFRLFDVDSQLNPILLEESPAGTSPRGGAGTAFDYGHDGLGFDLNGDTVKDGPVLSILDFASYPAGVQARGPFGIRARDIDQFTNNGLDVINGRIYDADSVDGLLNPIAPIINTVGSNGVQVSGTLWRDLSIDPRNGNLAARADNDLIIARRNPNNGVLSHVVVDGGSIPFQVLQRCELLHGFPGGDVVVYNRYGAGATTLNGWVNFVDLNGASVTVNLKNSDGTPFSAAGTTGVYDFSWDAANGRLAINDFNGRNVYIFSTTPPPPPCGSADFDGDGDTGTDADIEAFFACLGGNCCGTCGSADFDADGDTGTDADIEAFFRVLGGGAC